MSWADDTEDMNWYLNTQGKPNPDQLREWRSKQGRWGGDGHQWLDPGPASATAREALKTILTTGRRSRFRQLAVVCRRNHTIAEVYQTSAGLVLCGSGPLATRETVTAGGETGDYSSVDDEGDYFEPVEWSYDYEQTRRLNRETPVVCLLDQLRRQDQGWRVVTMQCRCTTAELAADDLDRYLSGGKKRVVYVKPAQRT